MQRMETYLCSEERRRRRWCGGSFLLFPGVAPLSFGFFFVCRREMVASPFFFPSLFSFFPFEIVFRKEKKTFGLCFRTPLLWTKTTMVRVLEPGVGWTQAFSGSLLCFCSGSASGPALTFLCFSGFFVSPVFPSYSRFRRRGQSWVRWLFLWFLLLVFPSPFQSNPQFCPPVFLSLFPGFVIPPPCLWFFFTLLFSSPFCAQSFHGFYSQRKQCRFFQP